MAGRDGILYLMVNDHPSWFGDNSGQVSAWVERVAPARAAPAAPRQDTTEIIIRQESVEGYDGSRESDTVRIRQGSRADDSR